MTADESPTYNFSGTVRGMIAGPHGYLVYNEHPVGDDVVVELRRWAQDVADSPLDGAAEAKEVIDEVIAEAEEGDTRRALTFREHVTRAAVAAGHVAAIIAAAEVVGNIVT